VDVVINEADGSRMRPFKAPNEREPVIPDSTTLLAPVAGIDVVGQPLDDEYVHRAERVAALAGVKLGTSVEPELVARILAHEQGGLKNKPPQARVIPLVNKVQNAGQLLIARDLAGQLLRSDAVEAVAIGAVKNAAMPIAELQQRVSAVILAAGGSSRMQGPLKQLLPWGDSTLVRHTVEVVRRAQVAEIVVVVGRQAEEVRRELREMEGIRIVENPRWSEGRASSVRAGIEAVRANSAAAIFVNADQPFLTTQVIDAILQRYFQTLAPVVVPVYEGQTGSPVLFARRFFGEMRNLRAEYGGKEIFKAHRDKVETVNILNVRAGIDVDTPEQYRAALAEAKSNQVERIFSTVQSTTGKNRE
jgi:molybdenum cofactor cytidylyltransferase